VFVRCSKSATHRHSPALIAASNVHLESLLRDLQADPPGESAYDALQHLMQASASLPEVASEEQLASALSHPALYKLPSQQFVLLPLSVELSLAYRSLNVKFADAPEESVSPIPVLIALLESDPPLLRLFEHHGLTLSILRPTL